MILFLLKRWRYDKQSVITFNKVRFLHTTWEPWEDQLLQDYVKSNGKKWNSLVQHALPHKTVNACMIRWSDIVNPSIQRGSLTPFERKQFERGIETLGVGQWKQIAAQFVPQRSPRQLANIWSLQINPQLSKRKYWTKEEDELLIKGVKLIGYGKWESIHRLYLPHRSRVSIKQRYDNHVNPSIKHDTWTTEEMDILLRRTVVYGTENWEKVVEGLPGRTVKQCKVKYDSCIDPSRTQSKKPWSKNDIQLFWELVYIHHGKWATIAKYLKRADWECSSLFNRTLKNELSIIYNEKDILQQPEETKSLWKKRIGKLMMTYLDRRPRAFIQKENKSMVLKLDGEIDRGDSDKTNENNNDNDTNKYNVIDIKNDVNNAQNKLNKDYRLGKWTDEEDIELEELMNKYGKDWNTIAKYHDTRTAAQCRYRYTRVLQYKSDPTIIYNKSLTEQEKARILHGVDIFGHNWVVISKTFLPHRKPVQLMTWYLKNIKHKYENNINHMEQLLPGTGKWTKEEDERLIFAMAHYQHERDFSWGKIARLVNTKRSANQCRQHWETCLNHNITKKGHWDWNERLQLVELVQKHKMANSTTTTTSYNPDDDFEKEEKGNNTQSMFWERISKELNTGRSAWSCRLKYSSMARSGNFFK
ncbi:hypothetical protein BJ944DRAFT_198463 [Cunninghamella echinulata]|nr:hypothetical protein BJ944DRAFT_198463 [Cunninghamella echinulata]